jgi:competence protein ComEC
VVSGAGASSWGVAALLVLASLALLRGVPRRLLPLALLLVGATAIAGHLEGRARIDALPTPGGLPTGALAGGYVRGTVVGFPERRDGEWSWLLGGCSSSGDGEVWRPFPGRIRVYADVAEGPLPGSTLVVGGRVKASVLRRNFGTPSPEGGRGIRCEIGSLTLEGEALLLTERPGGGPMASLFRFRERSRRTLCALVGERQGGLLAAVVLGMQGELAPEERETFRRLGVSHLIAVSGLNLALLFGLIQAIVLRGAMAAVPRIALRLRIDVVSSCVAILPVTLFVLLTGANPPVIRAFLSMAAAFLALAALRRIDGAAALALLAAGMASTEPLLPFTASFLLTVAGTAGLVLFFGDERGDPLRQATLLPLAAFIIVGPTSFTLFHSLPLLFYPANLLLAPFFGLVVIPGVMVSLVLLPVAPAVGMFILSLVDGVAGPLLAAMRRVAALSGAEFPTVGPSAAACVAATLVIGWIYTRRSSPWSRIAAGGIVLAIAALLPNAALRDQTVEVTFLDLPLGESIVVRRGGEAFVVDTGGKVGGLDPGAAVIFPELRSRGLTRAGTLLLTHPHLDHVDGAATVGGIVETILLSFSHARETDRRSLLRPGAGLVPAGRGDRFDLAGLPAEILWPPKSPTGPGDANDRSIALLLKPHGVGLLLAGDLTGEALTGVIRESGGAALFKATHHGGSGSFPPGVVDLLRPSVVVVAGRSTARPPGPWREAAGQGGFHLLDTAEGGAVRLTVDVTGEVGLSRPPPLLRRGRKGG